MDFKIFIFILSVTNVLECTPLTFQEKLNLFLQFRRLLDDNPKIIRRNYDGDNANEFQDSRRSLVSEEEPAIYVSRKSINYGDQSNNFYNINRRFYDFHAGMRSRIIGAPTMPQQLPEAEPILPGHTLIRPALGMLKSSVKFPHKDLDDGVGVYGNINSIGLPYGATGERVLYTGFRRKNDDYLNYPQTSEPILVLLLRKRKGYQNKYALPSRHRRIKKYFITKR